MKGYETYAVLKGGEKVIQFSDNSDIVTDKEASAVEVVPKGKKDPIKFIPRGRNNDMMYDIMRKIGTNVTIGSNVEFKNKVVFGDSILVYRKKRDGKTRKIIKEEVLPEEEPEIFEFLENNNFNFIRVELANDLVIFYDAYLEYILSNDPKSPKLVHFPCKGHVLARSMRRPVKVNGMGIQQNGRKEPLKILSPLPCSIDRLLCWILRKGWDLLLMMKETSSSGKIADSFTICVFRRQDVFIIAGPIGGAYLLQDGMISPALFPSSRNL